MLINIWLANNGNATCGNMYAYTIGKKVCCHRPVLDDQIDKREHAASGENGASVFPEI